MININTLLTLMGARRWLRLVKVNGERGCPLGLSFNDFLGYLDSEGKPPLILINLSFFTVREKCSLPTTPL